jgi:hypothetical protein
MAPPAIRGIKPVWLIPLVFLWQPICGVAAEMVFSGGLERVGHESISVRLADRIVIETRLSATSRLATEKISAQYKIGDQVEITCRQIRPVWEDETGRYQFLELTKLRFLRKPSSAELSEMLAIQPWRGAPNLLSQPSANTPAPKQPGPATLSDAVPDTKLTRAREVNLEYASSMPDFVADETAKRSTANGRSQDWHYVDTIETEITFKGDRAFRDQIRKDGKPWGKPFRALPGFKWYGGFGTEIKQVFDPQCPTSIEADGIAEVHGKRLLKYKFRSPADGCFGPFYLEYQRYNPARTGHVFIDATGGNVIKLDEEASGFPPGFDLAQRNEEVSWDYVKIGDASHLLPVGANFLILYYSGIRWRIEVEYKNHRHFESSSNITFH